MKRRLALLFGVALLFISAHRLPAPIAEESTPTPPPQQSAKPKPKLASKPKPKPELNESSTNPVRQQPSSKQGRFAGTWVGTIPAFPTGPQDTVLTIDPKETTMLHTWINNPPTQVAKADINGDTIQATFPNGVATYTFSVTPMPDGVTASVRLQAFMNDNRAVFHRVAESSAKAAR